MLDFLPTMLRLVLSLVLLAGICLAEPHLPPGTMPLPSAAEKGRGPLALVNLNHHVLGACFVYGSKFPDLFVAGYGGAQAVHLFRWVDIADTGAPVFAQPVELKCPFKDKGTVFQTKDGSIQGLWIDKEALVHTVFDRETLEFREMARLPLDKQIKSPSSLAVLANADGSYDLAFEMSNGGKGPPGHPWAEDWRPYNSSGISVGELRYRYLFGAHLPALLKGPLTEVRQITATQKEVFYSMHQITGVNLGHGHERDLVTGSRQGNLVFYHNPVTTGFKLEKKRLAAGPDGNALRHPSINPSVCAYPNAKGLSDIIACGEGSLYFYRFTGKFTASGAPIYLPPASVLQEQADLYAGTLPTPTTVDWNDDGVLDILVGNSEGFVLFFENIGSNDEPRFLPSTRVQAGGQDIQVQAGYAGSLQGVQEARWGYLSPNVVDWNEDGLLDILTGDITGNYHIYLNRGSKKEPRLDPAHPLYCDGLDLHGIWRVRPAAAKLGERMALALVDGEDQFHLYWRVDDYNVEDAGKLRLSDDKIIGASGGVGGMSGRCKLDFFDWNQDGHLDLILGTGRVNSIPDRETGFPMPAIGKKTLGTPLLMLNKGTDKRPRFAMPVPFRDENDHIIQPGGAHETGAVGTYLGKDGPNLLICNEAGRLFLLPGKDLKWKP
jgi:hypothetical protein